MEHKKVRLKEFSDIVTARQACREMARQLGFGSADQTRLATAVSELARNVIQYAGAGECVVSDDSDGDEIRIRVVVEDHGPGIPDLGKAMEPGFSTNAGLGAGLPGAKRLVHEFHAKSVPGHTIINVRLSRKRT